MSKIAIFLANGFEEIEGLTVVDICRRCGPDHRYGVHYRGQTGDGIA